MAHKKKKKNDNYILKSSSSHNLKSRIFKRIPSEDLLLFVNTNELYYLNQFRKCFSFCDGLNDVRFLLDVSAHRICCVVSILDLK